jgi:hypothetical protein
MRDDFRRPERRKRPQYEENTVRLAELTHCDWWGQGGARRAALLV